ncbi:AMP-binding protein [Streptomyces sp. NPDC017260]|uniref:AMP-binding protein n=1 Tax=unclassified Streptomyces TaxID=2593676 RepID=UPI00379F278E
MTSPLHLTRGARHRPEHPAPVCDDRTWIYARLEERANRLASALVRRGLGPDDAVARPAWNRHELIEVEFALYKAGLMTTSVVAGLSGADIARAVTDDPDLLRSCGRALPRRPERPDPRSPTVTP